LGGSSKGELNERTRRRERRRKRSFLNKKKNKKNLVVNTQHLLSRSPHFSLDVMAME